MVFRRISTYGMVAVVLVFAAMMLLASPAWAQNLNIEKRDNPDPVEVGELLTFTLTVDNEGDPTGANEVVVEDRLPEGVRVVGITTSDPADCTLNERERRVRCEFEEAFTMNDTATVRITVEPLKEDNIENIADVFLVTSAGPTRQDRDRATTTVEANEVPDQNPTAPVVVIIDDDGDDEGNGDDGDSGDSEQDEEDSGDEEDNEEVSGEDIDTNNDGVISPEEQEAAYAENELDALENGEGTDGEDTLGDAFDEDGDDGPVSAQSGEDGAEASTPGAVASSGDPDEQEPVTEAPDDVEDEIDTGNQPLPNTYGANLLIYALPTAGALLLMVALIRRVRFGS